MTSLPPLRHRHLSPTAMGVLLKRVDDIFRLGLNPWLWIAKDQETLGDMTNQISSAERWKAHVEKDRDRSAKARVEAKALGKPTAYQVNAAIADAMQGIWSEKAASKLEGRTDRASWQDALSKPIALDRIAMRAVEILVQTKRADPKLAGKAVIDRIRPPFPDAPLIIEKASPALTARLTSYSA